MTECDRKGKFFGGCKFQPRYDEHPPQLDSIKGGSQALEAISLLTERTYVCDVCVRCGRDTKRSVE